MTYEYEFVEVECKGGAVMLRQPTEDYQAIITQHAAQGWRLVQMVSTKWQGWQPYSFDLIFERPKTDGA